MIIRIVTTGLTIVLLVVLFFMAYNNFAPKKEKVAQGVTVSAGERRDIMRSFNEKYSIKEIDSIRAALNYDFTRELAMANVPVRETPTENN